MTTTNAPFVPSLNFEPIPGYILKSRLGSGGAGEVWRAEAPGGLPKAIKFVYGTLDEKRASQELKSLNRIKDVHHPFLLSLDRIEVVDGHLVIVSELANGCLKDRFDACRAEGLDGIPRDELLGYLRDTADVLDFIYDKHSLQHLDIKPENLLLLGNHVKVADFGLLKNVHDLSESMIGGLTPLYAPPEVLCGRPSRYSDQYSLAIVFQEMLTGQPPFVGRNTAQLAAQHLHSSPSISCLPLSDQAVVSRALSKKPEARYPGCRAFIESLVSPPARAVTSSAPAPRAKAAESTQVSKTEMLDGPTLMTNTVGDKRLLPSTSTEVRGLDRIPIEDKAAPNRPTIFVGVGGTGVKILHQLLRRLNIQWGNLNDVPAVQMVLLDTDRQSLTDPANNSGDVANYGVAKVSAPLRASSDYRADSRELLEWISRRWLFNIPRSQLTEGMRPLGRLAFVDHYNAIRNSLRRAISAAVLPESVQESSASTGTEFQATSPRIFVVSSLAGGAGGGMVMDLAYTIRTVLKELNLPDEGVNGILTHSTNRSTNQRDLAVANTCASLCEMIHYSKIGSYYPGDRACELPAFYDDNAAFHNAYVVHLGDGLSDNEFDGATDQVAEYLFQNVATPAASFFDAARAKEHETSPSPLGNRRVRTIGITRQAVSGDKLRSAEEQQLCLEVINSWLAPSQKSPEAIDASIPDPAVTEATAYVATRGLALDPLLKRAADAVLALTTYTPDELVKRMVTHIVGQNGPSTNKGEALSAIDAMFQHGEVRADLAPHRPTLYIGLMEKLHGDAHQQGVNIKSWLFNLIDTPGSRVQAALTAANHFSTFFAEMQSHLRTQLERLEMSLRERQAKIASVTDLSAALYDYGSIRLQMLMHRSIQASITMIMNHVNAATGEFRRLDEHAINLRNALQPSQWTPELSQASAAQGVGDRVWTDFVSSLRNHTGDLVRELDKDVSGQLKELKFSFANMLSTSTARATFVDIIRKCSRNVLRVAMRDFEQGQALDLTLFCTLPERLKATSPKLLACGGASRLLMVAPNMDDRQQIIAELESQSGQQVTAIEVHGESIVLCQEAEQVPLENILSLLVGGRSDLIDAAQRLYTRTDVAWSLV